MMMIDLGNHEYYHGGIDEWLQHLRSLGILPLHNSNLKIKKSNNPVAASATTQLCIAGVDDLFASKSGYFEVRLQVFLSIF